MFTFSDVPAGSYVLDTFEPRTQVVTSLPVTVVQDQTTTQNVTVVSVGTVQVQVNFARGVPAQGARVTEIESGFLL